MNAREWKSRWPTMSPIDLAYTAGLVLWCILLTWLILRTLARTIIILRFAIPRQQRPRTWRSVFMTLILAGLAFVCVGAGWPFRIGQLWVADDLQKAAAQIMPRRQPVRTPSLKDESQTKAVILSAITQGTTPKHRITGAKILFELNLPERDVAHALSNAFTREKDPAVAALQLRLLGLHRRSDSIDTLFAALDDARPQARAAAADGIGFFHSPLEFIHNEYDIWQTATNTDPPIPVGAILLNERPPRYGSQEYKQSTLIPPPRKHREKLESMMLRGQSLEEREAAARALLAWPPENYRLRVAEWGVWLNESGDLKTLKSVQADMPPFVHHTGDPVSTFASRINQIMVVTKPVIHITADRPMSVDIQVLFNRGRPWVAYPKPDDFAVMVQTVPVNKTSGPTAGPRYVPPDDATITPLDDTRQGYPWLTPAHPTVGPAAGQMGGVNDITHLGLRWQSVIVSPTKLDWMSPPDVGADPNHQWWKRLRDVECSWISSRGESEKFLYYDGPTMLLWPLMPRITESGRLEISEGPRVNNTKFALNKHELRDHLLIRVDQNSFTMESWPATLASDNWIPPRFTGDRAISAFLKSLTTRGLTASESAGLLDCWRKDFFEKPGARVITFMSRKDYDDYCPITIRPTPTQLTRVGLVVTELK